MLSSAKLNQISRSVVRTLAYRIALNESGLESQIQHFFPMKMKKLGTTIILSDPKIRLCEVHNRIHLLAQLTVELPGNFSTSGQIELAGTLLYVAQEGAFYLDNPVICQFSILSIPSRYLSPIKLLVQNILSRYVQEKPLYKFRSNSFKHKLAKLVFRTVEVRKGKLRVRFALS